VTRYIRLTATFCQTGCEGGIKLPARLVSPSPWPHAVGVKSLIWVILAAGKRVNKSLRYSNGLIPCHLQLPSRRCHDFIIRREKLDVEAQPHTVRRRSHRKPRRAQGQMPLDYTPAPLTSSAIGNIAARWSCPLLPSASNLPRPAGWSLLSMGLRRC